MICCICGKEFGGFGANPAPYMAAIDDENNARRCCYICERNLVYPARSAVAGSYEFEQWRFLMKAFCENLPQSRRLTIKKADNSGDAEGR